ncbi:MAG TPA: hypothetical protein VNO30_07145 [Kofleriaceae bacterium]|nr:hypothetical protein [Kofleriaceae bacterium]
MHSALTTIANVTAADLTAADAFGGFLVLIVAILSFLSISGLALSMTIGASKASGTGTSVITAVAGVLSVLIAVGLFSTVSVHHSLKIDGCPAEGWDRLGGTLAMIIGSVALLSIGGILVTSSMAAFAGRKSPVSSWPMHEEQLFAVYDQRINAAQSRAWAVGVAAGVSFFLFAIGVYKGIEPDRRDISKDMNMDNLTKKKSSDAPKAAPKAETPKSETPKTEAPKGDAPKGEAPKAESSEKK